MFVGGTAHAITDTIFKYSTVKTGYLALNPTDFAPGSQVAAASPYVIDPTAFGCIYYLSSPSSGYGFVSGLHLPQGAKITTVAAWFSTSSGKAAFQLTRQNFGTGAVDIIANKTDSDTSGVYKPVSVNVASTLQAVDNLHYHHGLQIVMGADTYFCGTRITDTYTNAGD